MTESPTFTSDILKTVRHLFWAIVTMAAIVAGYRIAPQVAQSVRPQFITVYDSTTFNHARTP